MSIIAIIDSRRGWQKGETVYNLAFAIFGILGALLRYVLEWWLANPHFPQATLLINWSGCFMLAVVSRFLIWIPKFPARLASAIGTGFVGSFTTFSTFSLESVQLFQRGAYCLAALYVLLSAFGGLAACLLGTRFSLFLLKRRKGGKRHAA
ncbi:MAG: CrcB family protein [Sporolactobacillus sp.]